MAGPQFLYLSQLQRGIHCLAVAKLFLLRKGQSMASQALTRFRTHQGQSLIEAALLLPMLLAITFNAVNMGYFCFTFMNLATGVRQGAEYSIQGLSSYSESDLPSASNVSTLVYAGINGSMSGTVNTPMRVCSLANGVDPDTEGTADQIPLCSAFGAEAGSFTALEPDPEAPSLVLNRVDIQYTVTAPIQGFMFNLIFPPSLIFHRYVYMRAEN